jgi:hypothetical protein
MAYPQPLKFSNLREADYRKKYVNLKKLIDPKKCIVFNLDKGKMSAEVSAQFGKLGGIAYTGIGHAKRWHS